MLDIVLTEKAAQELDAITTYTAETFGELQAFVYANALLDAFSLIGENPKLGRDYSDQLPGVRRLTVRKHVVYYEILDQTIAILRILHQAQDPMRQFEGDRD